MISAPHVNKTALSLLAKGQMTPVILSADGTIVDGQHRVTACEQLHIPVMFLIMSTIANAQEAQTIINMGQKSWTENDFLHSGIEQGIENYCFVKQLNDTYNITATALSDTRILAGAQHKIKFLKPINLSLPIDEMISILDEHQLVLTAYKKIFGSRNIKPFNRAFGYLNAILRPKISNFSWEYIAKNLEHTKTNPNYSNGSPRSCQSEMDFIHYFGSAFNYKKTTSKQNHMFFQGKFTK